MTIPVQATGTGSNVTIIADRHLKSKRGAGRPTREDST